MMIDETQNLIMQKLLEKTPTNVCLYFDQKFVDAVLSLHVLLDSVEKAHLWLITDNPNLGGIAPMRLINIGRGEKVYQFIDQAIHDLDNRSEVNFG